MKDALAQLQKRDRKMTELGRLHRAIVIPLYYSIVGRKKTYDIDSMRDEFEDKLSAIIK